MLGETRLFVYHTTSSAFGPSGWGAGLSSYVHILWVSDILIHGAFHSFTKQALIWVGCVDLFFRPGDNFNVLRGLLFACMQLFYVQCVQMRPLHRLDLVRS